MADSPYPELKKTHTMMRKGRPWRDYKPVPSGPVWAVIQGSNTYWSLVAAVELGVFDAMTPDEEISAADMAEALSVDLTALEHLLDAMTTIGFLEQLDDLYSLTDTAIRYLRSDGAASMKDLIAVSNGPLENWTNLAETIRTGKPIQPVENDMAGFYTPLVEATFPTQYRASTRLGLKIGFDKMEGLKVLDVGAGYAPWAASILELSKGSTAVINDIEDVLVGARAKMATLGLEDRVSYLSGDFHVLDFGDGVFDVVVLGHVCRTEGPSKAPGLIQKAVRALKPGGRLIMADYFADNDRKLNTFGVQMGLTMLANTMNGQILTNAQAVEWLRACPLEAIRLIEPIGYNFAYVATKTV
ncbi:MAG: class I SAM-dependent methyltransferase [Pseudomonadota bacterium]